MVLMCIPGSTQSAVKDVRPAVGRAQHHVGSLHGLTAGSLATTSMPVLRAHLLREGRAPLGIRAVAADARDVAHLDDRLDLRSRPASRNRASRPRLASLRAR